jgi:hypothetical protein
LDSRTIALRSGDGNPADGEFTFRLRGGLQAANPGLRGIIGGLASRKYNGCTGCMEENIQETTLQFRKNRTIRLNPNFQGTEWIRFLVIPLDAGSV